MVKEKGLLCRQRRPLSPASSGFLSSFSVGCFVVVVVVVAIKIVLATRIGSSRVGIAERPGFRRQLACVFF